MTLEAYLRIARRYWLALLVGLVGGTLIAFAVTVIQPKTYTADSSGFITTPSTSSSGSGVGTAVAGDTYAKSRAKSYADLGKKRVVAEDVIQDLGLNTTPEQLVDQITVTAPTDTVTIKVSAKASTAQGASDLANAWIRAMSTEIAKLENGESENATSDGTTQQTTATPAATLTSLESAAVPTSPTSPNRRLYLAVGALAGLLLAFGYALLRNQYDKRIRSADDVAHTMQKPIIGTLPLEKALVGASSRLIQDAGQHDARRHSAVRHISESLRELRTNIDFLDVDDPPRGIVITSALPGDGKSTVAANLAVTMAETGRTVILIDADLRKPTVANTFNVPGEVGLSDVLAGRATLEVTITRPDPQLDLFVLPAGSIPPNPSELLGSDALHELVQSFVAEGATVLLDAPPLLPVTDAAVLTARTDGALIVASAGQTRVDSLQQALERIDAVKGTTLGIVLNRVPTKGLDSYAYGYYGGDYYGEESDHSSKRHGSRRSRRQRPAAQSHPRAASSKRPPAPGTTHARAPLVESLHRTPGAPGPQQARSPQRRPQPLLGPYDDATTSSRR